MNINNKYSFRILLIEDNYEEAFLIEDLLNIPKYKFQVTHLTHLKKAIEFVKYGTYDIILLNPNLPDCKGLESIEKLYKADKTIPVIILSAKPHDLRHSNVLVAELNEILIKGQFTGNELLTSIKSAISLKNEENDIRNRTNLHSVN